MNFEYEYMCVLMPNSGNYTLGNQQNKPEEKILFLLPVMMTKSIN